ncbi:hypothetical protein GEMRC1_013494 [Eukaryota sp. GEM-RC1]
MQTPETETTLCLHSVEIPEAAISHHLSQYPHLEHLTLTECHNLRVVFLKHPTISSLTIENCSNLFMLDLKTPQLHTLRLSHLPKFSLNPVHLRARAASLKHFQVSDCPSMFSSSLMSQSVSLSSSFRADMKSKDRIETADEAFSNIIASNLESLVIEEFDALNHVKFPNIPITLKSLSVVGCMSFVGFKLTDAFPCTSVCLLDLSFSSIRDQSLPIVTKLFPNLYELLLIGCSELNRPLLESDSLVRLDLSFSKVSGLKGYLPSLESLSICDYVGSTSCFESVLKNCPNISYLDASFCSATRLIIELPNLESLILCGCKYLENVEILSVNTPFRLLDFSGSRSVCFVDCLLPLKNTHRLPLMVLATLPKKFSVLDYDITDINFSKPLTWNELESKFPDVEFIWWGNGEPKQEAGAPSREVWSEGVYLESRGLEGISINL